LKANPEVPPLGLLIDLPFQTQMANAAAARMTLYDFDFVAGGAQLNYRGQDRLRQIAGLLPYNQFPVVVERMPFAPGLAEARRMTILNELAAVLPPERVVVGPPLAVPLRGVEATYIYRTLMTQTRNAGFPPLYYGGGSASGTSINVNSVSAPTTSSAAAPGGSTVGPAEIP
jgi:hypothetical protein